FAVAVDVRYLIFDVESVADGELIAKTRYPGRGLSPAQAVMRFRQDLLSASGRDFIPYTYHLPVAIVVAKVRADLSLIEIVSLDQPAARPHVMAKRFRTGWQAYEQPAWVTFSGRTFDLPLMEHTAFRVGMSVPCCFKLEHRTYEQNRNRYTL